MDLDGNYYWDAVLGNDVFPGTQARPFQTEAVLNNATSIAAGTRMHFRRGVGQNYGEVNAPAFDGTSGNPIVMQTWGSGILPVFTAAVDAVVDLGGNDWWTVQNLRLTGGLQPGGGVTIGGGLYSIGAIGLVANGLTIDNCIYGVMVKEGTGTRIQGCTIEDCDKFGVRFFGVINGLIDDNDVTNVTGDGALTGDGINVSLNCVNCTVSHNQISGDFPRQQMATSGSSGTTWESNLVAGAGRNALDLEAAVGHTVTDQIIRYNDFAPTAGDGVQISGGTGSTSGVLHHHNRIRKALVDSEADDMGLQVANATGVVSYGDVISGFGYNVYVNGTGELTGYNGTWVESQQNCVRLVNTASVKLRNNIIHDGADGIADGIIVMVHPTVTLDSDYNLIFSDNRTVDQVIFRPGFVPWLNFAGWQAFGQDANSQWANPLFADQAGGDYSLAAGSPAVDNGLTLADAYQMGLDPDTVWPDAVVLANQNDEGAGWEIGAYILEFESSSSSSSTSSSSSSSSSSPAIDVCPAGKSMSMVGPAGSTLAIPV